MEGWDRATWHWCVLPSRNGGNCAIPALWSKSSWVSESRWFPDDRADHSSANVRLKLIGTSLQRLQISNDRFRIILLEAIRRHGRIGRPG